jgi:hypothetical protein
MDALTAALIAFLSIAAGTAARVADRRVVGARPPLARSPRPRVRDGISALPIASS